MHYVSKTLAVAIAIFVTTTLVYRVTGQNCAIPQFVTLDDESDIKYECAPNGTIIAELSTKYIQSIHRVIQTPDNYIEVKLSEDRIILEVKTSLCPDTNVFGSKTFIDETWQDTIEVQVEFNCTDGRSKEVRFLIPIYDENTQSPKFYRGIYDLNIEPCITGSHQGTCPLNFEYPIYIDDNDRDVRNALMNFQTTLDQMGQTDFIRITYSEMELSYGEKSEVHANGHRVNVHLYLNQSDQFSIGDSLTFDLIAHNRQESPTGHFPFGKTTINITFGELPPFEPPNILEIPYFNSLAYYATVSNLEEAMIGLELQNIQPSNVAAYYVDQNQRETPMNIRYYLYSDIFYIDPETAKIRFITDLTLWPYQSQSPVQIYQITAVVESYEFLFSTVPLVVYFDIKSETSTTSPPDNCSTTTFMPPECPPPDNSTCPVVTCPTPEPCLGSSTTERGDYETSTLGTTEVITNDPIGTTTSSSWTTSETPWTSTTSDATTTEITEPTSPTPTQSTTSTPTVSTTSASEPTEWPTSEPTESTTLNPTEPSTSEPTDSTPPETTPNEPTTTEFTTPISSTTPPVNETCCASCGIIPHFKCPSGENPEYKYQDPVNCTIFHQCADEHNGIVDRVQSCPNGTIFCPSGQTCTFAADCKCARDAYKDKSLQSCEDITCQCDDCLMSYDPENICRAEGKIPDPVYCDVFHDCRPEKTNSTTEFIDCRLECPQGLVWCQRQQTCQWPTECPCDENKVPLNCPFCAAPYSVPTFSFSDMNNKINYNLH